MTATGLSEATSPEAAPVVKGSRKWGDLLSRLHDTGGAVAQLECLAVPDEQTGA